ncbi:MAG: methyltransferase domain-containing protein [Bdellovibrionales bacterium]|nr:methyltransferase domain-containing protein [Bdellovibrionales bacterium]
MAYSTSHSVKHSVKHLILAAKSMVKSDASLNPIGHPPSATPTIDIPQAGIVETHLQAYEPRDWRSYFAGKLSGKGLEIGPLHRPMVRHDGMDIDYIDRCTVAELREHYPELNELPLVEPDIIGDAETLEGVPDRAYDFLISAHVIEHMKNPLGSLAQWCRVVRPGGLIYLIVPDKRATFDKKRVRTTLAHLVLDYRRPSAERDYEHYLDYAVHVHDKDAQEAVIEADRLIETDYSIHFHVFLPSDVIRLLRWFSENIRPLSIVEGPVMTPGSDEFHFLLKVES